ncbi:DUF2280 domain-containing protein [Mesorhizobium shangrilense]|uniref:DUF2280 domain-containing protein n=1 Tax=Mesorhizobium shangrilense TaxID=460060 RepID=A0ABV2DFW5_9HYPH
MATAKLSEAAKIFVVQRLACFDTPSELVGAVRKEFGDTITRQTVEAYDPTKKAGRNISTKWKTLFDETRKAFLEDTAAIAISHRTVRLRTLQRMAEKAETQGNIAMVMQLLEQAAKEMGNAFTNRREITGRNGGALETQVTQKLDATLLTDEELEIMIRAAERREGAATQG